MCSGSKPLKYYFCDLINWSDLISYYCLPRSAQSHKPLMNPQHGSQTLMSVPPYWLFSAGNTLSPSIHSHCLLPPECQVLVPGQALRLILNAPLKLQIHSTPTTRHPLTLHYFSKLKFINILYNLFTCLLSSCLSPFPTRL